MTQGGQIVVISQDGVKWELPGGRPERNEDWRETLDREVLEEACATVERATLLGFSRGRCISGHEKGLVLVRSLWLADVTIHNWKPEHEVKYRKLVARDAVLDSLGIPDGIAPIYLRWFEEADAI